MKTNRMASYPDQRRLDPGHMRPSPRLKPMTSRDVSKDSGRMPWALAALLLIAAFLFSLSGCYSPEFESIPGPTSVTVSTATKQIFAEPISPLQAPQNLSPAKVELGRRLFHDKRLSADNSISCGTCHNIRQGGSDGLETPIGCRGLRGSLNTPTVFNCSLSLAQFWDGRVTTLEQQVSGPIHNPIEMATTWPAVIYKLKQDKAFEQTFLDEYPDGIREAAIIDAIATFERSLITVNAPFDRYLQGETTAISDEAFQGYLLFKNFGCISCHQGNAVGGNMFQKFGVMEDYFDSDAASSNTDRGRINVTDRPADLHRFKVPSLRNIELTGPYFHHGQTKTLWEAIEIMALHQLGTDLNATETRLIEAFLKSLTGEIKKEWE